MVLNLTANPSIIAFAAFVEADTIDLDLHYQQQECKAKFNGESDPGSCCMDQYKIDIVQDQASNIHELPAIQNILGRSSLDGMQNLWGKGNGQDNAANKAKNFSWAQLIGNRHDCYLFKMLKCKFM